MTRKIWFCTNKIKMRQKLLKVSVLFCKDMQVGGFLLLSSLRLILNLTNAFKWYIFSILFWMKNNPWLLYGVFGNAQIFGNAFSQIIMIINWFCFYHRLPIFKWRQRTQIWDPDRVSEEPNLWCFHDIIQNHTFDMRQTPAARYCTQKIFKT